MPLERNKALNRTPLHEGRIAGLRPLGAKSDRTSREAARAAAAGTGARPSRSWGGQAARRNGRRAHRSAATWSSARVPFATAVRTLSIRARAMCWICAIRHGRSPAGAPAPAEEGVDEGRSPRLAPSGGLPARLLDGCALRAAGRSPGPAGVDGPEERAAAANRRPED